MTGGIVVVMGVSGSGKTTIGERLGAACGVHFGDADRLHPPANVAKMAAGTPLTDEDRWPWLHAVLAWMNDHADRTPRTELGVELGVAAVVGCSALKRKYRDLLRTASCPVRFAYLKGDRRTLATRLHRRQGHFFPEQLLAAQLADLEEPAPDENPVVVSIGARPDAVVEQIVAGLRDAARPVDPRRARPTGSA
ncbi:gluconokinase [Luedemannella flava]|uniref:Gluconokinase n=2 Tax=Luedemannella flava TaxID=349316 RepID=A0ABN2LL13_9ACTN